MKKKRLIRTTLALLLLFVLAAFFLTEPVGRFFEYRRYVNHPDVAEHLRMPVKTIDLVGYEQTHLTDLGYAQFLIPPDCTRYEGNKGDDFIRYHYTQNKNLKTQIQWDRLPRETSITQLSHPIIVPTQPALPTWARLQKTWAELFSDKPDPAVLPHTPVDIHQIPFETNIEWFEKVATTSPLSPERVIRMDRKAYSQHILYLSQKANLLKRWQGFNRFETQQVKGFLFWYRTKYYYAGMPRFDGPNSTRFKSSGRVYKPHDPEAMVVAVVFDKNTGMRQNIQFEYYKSYDEIYRFLASMRYTLGDARTPAELEKLRGESRFVNTFPLH
ncbi:MAG: hypothetical protein ACYTGQ_15150 [Planctomycetota bacterium]|jgi:hypothetical protein